MDQQIENRVVRAQVLKQVARRRRPVSKARGWKGLRLLHVCNSQAVLRSFPWLVANKLPTTVFRRYKCDRNSSIFRLKLRGFSECFAFARLLWPVVPRTGVLSFKIHINEGESLLCQAWKLTLYSLHR